MATKYGREAAIPNPALEPFSVLAGTWSTVGTHFEGRCVVGGWSRAHLHSHRV